MKNVYEQLTIVLLCKLLMYIAGCGRSLHLNDSFNSSNRSTVHKQLPEVVEYILNHRNRKITSSATLDKRETKPTNQIAPIQTVCEKAAQTS